MENIIQLDDIRIERHKPRKCTCNPDEKKFTVDTVNKEITCQCGMIVDPFEAMEYLATHYERVNREHQRLYDQAQEWTMTKPYSVLFKYLEQRYRRGTMLPSCPKCEQMFDFKDITFWSNADFYRKLEQRLKPSKGE
jgi:hypothetical protein